MDESINYAPAKLYVPDPVAEVSEKIKKQKPDEILTKQSSRKGQKKKDK